MKKIFFLVLASLLALLLNSCPEDNPVTPDNQDLDLGPFTEYTLNGPANFTFADSLTGGTLIFPNGINGKVKIARIISGITDSLPDGNGFVFEIDPDINMLIQFPFNSDYMPDAFLYAQKNFSSYDSTNSKFWMSIAPQSVSSGKVIYDIVSNKNALDAKHHKTKNQFQGVFQKIKAWITSPTPKNFLANQTKAQIDADQIVMMNKILDKLSPTLKAYAQNEMNNLFKLNPSIVNKEASAYRAYKAESNSDPIHPGLKLYPHFNWNVGNVTNNTLAHESGHYLSHIILGDPFFYNNYYKQYNADYNNGEHEFGQIHPTRPLMEEWSMFVENMMIGYLKGSSNTQKGPELSNGRLHLKITNNGSISTPNDCDFVAKEGYIAFLLTQLNDKNKSIYVETDKNGVDLSEDKPIIGLNHEEIFDQLFISKPSKATDIYNIFKSYLAKKSANDEKKFIVLLEKTGWSYNGFGEIKYSDGSIVTGGKMKVGFSADGITYYTSEVEFKDGKFVLPRLYPTETMWLKITLPTQEVEIPLNALTKFDPARATNDAINLGTITIPKINRFSVGFELPKVLSVDGISANVTINGLFEHPKAFISSTGVVIPDLTGSYPYMLNVHVGGFASNEMCKITGLNASGTAPEKKETDIIPFNSSQYSYIKWRWKHFQDYETKETSIGSINVKIKQETYANANLGGEVPVFAIYLEADLYDSNKQFVKTNPVVVGVRLIFKPK